MAWFLLSSSLPTATISFSLSPSNRSLINWGFKELGRITPFLRTAFGKKSMASFVWNTIPSANRNSTFASRRISFVGYSIFGSATTETTVLQCSPMLVHCAIKLFFPLQENTISGFIFLKIFRSLKNLAKKLPILPFFSSSGVISDKIRVMPGFKQYSSSC